MAEEFPDFMLAKRVIITISYSNNPKSSTLDFDLFLEIISDIGISYREKFGSIDHTHLASLLSEFQFKDTNDLLFQARTTHLVSTDLLRLMMPISRYFKEDCGFEFPIELITLFVDGHTDRIVLSKYDNENPLASDLSGSGMNVVEGNDESKNIEHAEGLILSIPDKSKRLTIRDSYDEDSAYYDEDEDTWSMNRTYSFEIIFDNGESQSIEYFSDSACDIDDEDYQDDDFFWVDEAERIKVLQKIVSILNDKGFAAPEKTLSMFINENIDKLLMVR